MELRHLRYFIAVAEELHFGRAAQRLHIAQPPLSQQIRALEDELGVTLFARTQRSVSLTRAGKAFLEEAYKTVSQAEHAQRVAQRVARGEVGRLRIGFVASVAYGGLPEAIREFRTRSPLVALELQELTTHDLLAALEGETIDLAFFRGDETSTSSLRPQVLEWETVYCEPFVVALPEKHQLAQSLAVSLRRLRDEDFVLFPRLANPGLHDHLMRHCRERGFEPRIVQEANMMPTLIALVAAGLGVTLAPSSLINLQRAGVVYKRVVQPSIVSNLVAAWRRDDPSPARDAFMAAMREVAPQSVPFVR
jgi:DNA-binding transcriptional LysR family regulator